MTRWDLVTIIIATRIIHDQKVSPSKIGIDTTQLPWFVGWLMLVSAAASMQ